VVGHKPIKVCKSLEDEKEELTEKITDLEGGL